MNEMRIHLYKISADDGNTWTEQWLTDEEASEESKRYVCELVRGFCKESCDEKL